MKFKNKEELQKYLTENKISRVNLNCFLNELNLFNIHFIKIKCRGVIQLYFYFESIVHRFYLANNLNYLETLEYKTLSYQSKVWSHKDHEFYTLYIINEILSE